MTATPTHVELVVDRRTGRIIGTVEGDGTTATAAWAKTGLWRTEPVHLPAGSTWTAAIDAVRAAVPGA